MRASNLVDGSLPQSLTRDEKQAVRARARIPRSRQFSLPASTHGELTHGIGVPPRLERALTGYHVLERIAEI